MKLSDYVVDVIAGTGVKHVFMLAGGGAMHLNDSLGRSKRLEYVCNLHEQACAIAAEAYGQYTNNLGVCMVTTGPGSTNTLTGVAAGWMDSTPMLVISGQVKRADLCHGRGIRQMGFQEINIVPIVESITKYAVTITDPDSVRYHMEKAIWLAQNSRPGPSWIDIPLDVQATNINPEEQASFSPDDDNLIKSEDQNFLTTQVGKALELLSKSKKPIILVGNGVRLAKAEEKLYELVKKMNIPVLTTWKALDLFEEEDPLFIGRPGAVGQRAANIAQQKSDWLLMLGARMDMGQTAYMHKYLAREAIKIMVDVDKYEISKMKTTIDVPITSDAGAFIDEMLLQLVSINIKQGNFEAWRIKCHDWKNKFPVVLPEYWEYDDGVSLYALVEALSEVVMPGDLFVPGSSGACSEVSMQAFKSQKGVRVFNSEGMGPMGFGISGAIGGCIASGGKRTVCIDGDGGFAMNTQELETVSRLNLPITFFVLDNDGYASIRSTQKAYFEGRYYASSSEGGLTLPKIEKIADAYGIHFMEMKKSTDIRKKVKKSLTFGKPVICRVKVSEKQVTAPRVTSRQAEDGSMETAPMEEMWLPTSKLIYD
jgi:acetolactate synthase-1/2/3 large subunit